MEVKSDLKFNSLTSITYVPISLWHLLVTIHEITARAVYLKWPLRLLTASEVTSDLYFELSGLNNLCSSASLASILLEKPFVPKSFLLLRTKGFLGTMRKVSAGT